MSSIKERIAACTTVEELTDLLVCLRVEETDVIRRRTRLREKIEKLLDEVADIEGRWGMHPVSSCHKYEREIQLRIGEMVTDQNGQN